jgi:hypothetical protein
MFIFYSLTAGDPMLLDSPKGLCELERELNAFLESASTRASFAATNSGDPSPYSELLAGLRVVKTQGPNQLRLAEDRWLELAGLPRDLQQLTQALSGLEDGNHCHWYSTPISLIVEADEWRANRK